MLSTPIVQLCYGKITVILFFLQKQILSKKSKNTDCKCCALLAIIRCFVLIFNPVTINLNAF